MGLFFSKNKKKSKDKQNKDKQQNNNTYNNNTQPPSTDRHHSFTTIRSASAPSSQPTSPVLAPSSSSAVNNTNVSILTHSLPTIPTLTSPLSGRALHTGLPESDSASAAVNTNTHTNTTNTGDAVSNGESFRVINLDAIKPNLSAGGDAAYSFWDRDKTYRPEKGFVGARNAKLGNTIKATMRATLGGGDLMDTVKLPEGEDVNEWIAVNTVHFFNAASMIYGTCSQFCTPESCPTMSAGKCEWLWLDPPAYKKPTRVSAPLYIELSLTWVDQMISDTDIFPVDENAKFKRNFLPVVKNIYKRLFRLYAHLYYSHAEKIRSIGANAHLNTCFKHFIYFVLEFQLIDKNELQPLEKLIVKMRENDSQKAY